MSSFTRRPDIAALRSREFPNDLPAPTLVKQIVASLAVVSEENLDGAIVVVEPGRVRVRRNTKA